MLLDLLNFIWGFTRTKMPNMASIVTPNNWTDFLVLIVVFSVFNVLLVFLLLFYFYNTVTWNLWGVTITLPSLNHCAADLDPSLKIFRRPLVLFTSAEMTSTKLLKLCLCYSSQLIIEEYIIIFVPILILVVLRLKRFKCCVPYILVSLFLSLNKSTCQTRKNVFCFTSKALFVLKKTKF